MSARTTDDSFLAAILKSPDDDNLRLVYADWLEEQGDPRAEYVRLACQQVRDEKTIARMQELAAGFDSEWLATVTRGAVDLCDNAVEFEVECPMRWEQLRLTSDQNVRFCGQCEERVYFCTTAEDARDHARGGKCVCLCETVIATNRTELAAISLLNKGTMTLGLPLLPDDQ